MEAKKWRNITAFWLLGVCNNFGYVVMISAAHDLLSNGDEVQVEVRNGTRYCNDLSTGAILLADILPALIVKLVYPFVSIGMNIEVMILISSTLAGFILVGTYLNKTLMILGVVLTSLSCGVGESSFLSYMPHFDSSVISAWSAGTGGAGILGALGYLAFTWAGVAPTTTILIMNFIPVVMGVTFWIILIHPDRSSDLIQNDLCLGEKLSVFKAISVKYMVPFTLAFLLDYTINQGLSEVITYDGIFPALEAQYRWFSMVWQFGILLGRSSGGILAINSIWLLDFLQGMNLIFLSAEAIYRWFNSFWVSFLLILCEGLLGGLSYINTYRRVNLEMTDDKKEFAMAMTAFADSFGISIAGFIALPIHDAICRLPPP